MRERKNLGEKEENIKGKCRRDKENMNFRKKRY